MASSRLGLTAHATFSGALAWPYFYPWPQRPAGLIEAAFEELGRRWTPILNVFDEAGVDVCYELHPGEDLHDGVTFERFLKAVNDHKRANILYDPSHMILQQLDYLEFLDFYHERVRAFHVKDAEFRPNGRSGVYGGYQDWIDRPGRFRSLGDGQIDFKAIFSKMAQYDYPGWAVLEWECCIKHPKAGAVEGAALIKEWIIRVTDKAFDDFAGSGADTEKNRKILGLGKDEQVKRRCLGIDSCGAIDLSDVSHIAQTFFAGRLGLLTGLNAMGKVLGFCLEMRGVARRVGLIELCSGVFCAQMQSFVNKGIVYLQPSL